MNNETLAFAGSQDEQREKASRPILDALARAEKEFREWDATCSLIDDVYSRHGSSYERMIGERAWSDAELDLFWSSYEILKPAVYARTPVPAVAPMFSDGGKVKTTTAEVLERAASSTFRRTGINDVMTLVRDDLLFNGRGVMWMRYEDEDGKRVCVEHLDRSDFRHEPARKWSEVGWVAGGFWMDEDALKKRFTKLTDDDLRDVKFLTRREDHNHADADAMTPKAKVWEVWHRANNKVYWVTEGIDTLLEVGEPHLKLDGFFPCPRPAYGTLRRRSLVPVPDYERFQVHFDKISKLTARIYLLLEQVRMMGLVPAGGDIGDAISEMMRANDDQIIVPIPAGQMMDGAAVVQWLPLAELAQAIQGLIGARTQLIDDFYQLSGISDIMRGATEADETYGAQRLKSQFGSVRVREKIDELQRVAADAVKIASEIIAEEFDAGTLLEMAQMDLPTRATIEKRIKEIEDAAEGELKALADKAEKAAAEAGQVDPAQAQQMMAQAQQEVLAKYGPMLEEVQSLVPIDDVIDLLRDDRARSFAFEIESDSTIMPDEAAEKQSRTEFIGAFNAATQGLMSLAGMGEAGASLAGEMLRFTLAPYRVGRQLDSAIDAFVEAAPGMIAAQQGEGDAQGMDALAEAEKIKGQAAMAKVEADTAKAQAENERKMMEMQQKAASDQRRFQADMAKLQQSAEQNAIKAEEAMAKVDLLRAQTLKAMNEAGVVLSDQQLDEFKSLSDIELRERQEVRAAVNDERSAARADRGEMREMAQPVDASNVPGGDQ